jgi:copper resistance protein B
VQGVAPYFFNFAPTFYVRDEGRVAGRIQGSYNLYLSQRLILQPQVEMNFYSQVDRGRGIGTGLSDLDSGVRLAYQISRKFARTSVSPIRVLSAKQQLSPTARASLFMFPA